MDLVEKYGWAIPDDRALAAVAHFAPLVEIGAGAFFASPWFYQVFRAGILVPAAARSRGRD